MPPQDRIADLVKDKDDANTIRVECVIEEGAVEVAVFSGPNCYDRATAFCDEWYDGYNDHTADEETV